MIVWSVSRLSAGEDCLKRYWYQYVAKAPRGPEGIEAYMGQRVHAVLERLYRWTDKNGKPPALDAVLERFRFGWTAEMPKGGLSIARKGETVADYLAIGERCIVNYYGRNEPFAAKPGTVRDYEVKLWWSLAGRRFVGYIDRLERTVDGRHFLVADYKTSKRPISQADADDDDQLASYEVAVRQEWRVAETVKLRWHFVRAGVDVDSRRSLEQRDKLLTRTVARLEQLENLEEVGDPVEFKAKPSALCGWCNFKAICPDAARR